MTTPTTGGFPRSGARPVPTSSAYRDAERREAIEDLRAARGPAAASDHHGGDEAGEVSVAQLVGGITESLSTLVRQELALARAELRQEATKTVRAAATLLAAAVAAIMMLLFVSVAAWSGLSHLMPPAWAALVLGLMWAGIGVLAYLSGRAMLQRVDPTPTATADTLSDVPRTLRGRRGRSGEQS